MAPYRKFVVAALSVIVAVGNVLLKAMDDAQITDFEWGAVVVAALVAAGVYQVPNEPTF